MMVKEGEGNAGAGLRLRVLLGFLELALFRRRCKGILFEVADGKGTV